MKHSFTRTQKEKYRRKLELAATAKPLATHVDVVHWVASAMSKLDPDEGLGTLIGVGRRPFTVAGRTVCLIVLREQYGASFPEMSLALGRRSHSAVQTAWVRHIRGRNSPEVVEYMGKIMAAMEGFKRPEPPRAHKELDGNPTLIRRLLAEVGKEVG